MKCLEITWYFYIYLFLYTYKSLKPKMKFNYTRVLIRNNMSVYKEYTFIVDCQFRQTFLQYSKIC